MFTKKILLKGFPRKKSEKIIEKKLKIIINEKNEIFKSMSKNYHNRYNIRHIKKINGKNDIRLIGVGGSILGSQAIYTFLKDKIKKKFHFINDLKSTNQSNFKKKVTNIIVSKSGNTLETISNANIFIKKRDKNIFITENKKSYLLNLAQKLKAEIVHHNDFIGGRYSVLSEVGMLPAELMGLDPSKFRQFNNLIKNKKFLNLLVQNTNSILHFSKKRKFNSIILNYDHKSDDLFQWYQQLVAESLGKKGKGILPIISTMPKDNHSVMQLYIDGFKNNFFTFFYCKEKNSVKINKNNLLPDYKYLGSSRIDEIIFKQKIATEKVFKSKDIPFRSFELKNRDEKSLGEIFCFFILETILLGRVLNINPFDQPSVELVKMETKKQFS
jgi:glucose-6-phosphate isomerase